MSHRSSTRTKTRSQSPASRASNRKRNDLIPLKELIENGIVCSGDTLTVTLPSEYDGESDTRYSSDATITSDGWILHNYERFSDLESLFQHVQKLRCQQLRKTGSRIPKSPSRPPPSANLCELACIEGVPISHLIALLQQPHSDAEEDDELEKETPLTLKRRNPYKETPPAKKRRLNEPEDDHPDKQPASSTKTIKSNTPSSSIDPHPSQNLTSLTKSTRSKILSSPTSVITLDDSLPRSILINSDSTISNGSITHLPSNTSSNEIEYGESKYSPHSVSLAGQQSYQSITMEDENPFPPQEIHVDSLSDDETSWYGANQLKASSFSNSDTEDDSQRQQLSFLLDELSPNDESFTKQRISSSKPTTQDFPHTVDMLSLSTQSISSFQRQNSDDVMANYANQIAKYKSPASSPVTTPIITSPSKTKDKLIGVEKSPKAVLLENAARTKEEEQALIRQERQQKKIQNKKDRLRLAEHKDTSSIAPTTTATTATTTTTTTTSSSDTSQSWIPRKKNAPLPDSMKPNPKPTHTNSEVGSTYSRPLDIVDDVDALSKHSTHLDIQLQSSSDSSLDSLPNQSSLDDLSPTNPIKLPSPPPTQSDTTSFIHDPETALPRTEATDSRTTAPPIVAIPTLSSTITSNQTHPASLPKPSIVETIPIQPVAAVEKATTTPALPTPQPISSPVKPSSFVAKSPLTATRPGPVILCSGLSQGMLDKTKMLVKKLGGEVLRTFEPRVTHLVIFCDNDGIPKTTIKFHQCILLGSWIVSFTWILNSFRDMKWGNEIGHIVKGFPGVIAGRTAVLKHEPKLFESHTFCLFGEYKVPSKSEVASLIRLGNGRVQYDLPPLPETSEQHLGTGTRELCLCSLPPRNFK